MSKHLSLWIYKALAGLSILAGTGGMSLSFLFMACADTPDIISGAAGFIAGSILIGAGVIALAILALPMLWTLRDSEPSAFDSEL